MIQSVCAACLLLTGMMLLHIRLLDRRSRCDDLRATLLEDSLAVQESS